MTTPVHIVIEIEDEAAMGRFAEDVAMILAPGDVIALDGDLGAGKTTFARAVLRALADEPELEVPSPTFTLAQEYDLPRHYVVHFDLYRLSEPSEIDEIGFDEAVRTGVCLIEWPERAENRLPADSLRLSIETLDDVEARRVTLGVPNEEWRQRLTRSFQLRGFLNRSDRRGAHRRFLQGDASTRAYERIFNDDARAVLMNAPARPDGPPVLDGLPYSRIAHLAEDVRPFVAIGETLREAGFSAPELLASDIDAGLLLLEDLGGEGVTIDETPIPERYRVAVELLADLHDRDWTNSIALPDGSTHAVPAYDRRAMTIEIDLLADWYAPHQAGAALTADDKTAFHQAWESAFELLEGVEKSWTLRDFHSPNLLWLADRDDIRRIGLLDYQDTVIGPAAYDLASLLQDARVTVPAGLERELFDHYCALRRTGPRGFDTNAFEAAYAIMAAQRVTKVLGIFVRLNIRDGKPDYLRHIPRLKNYLQRSLTHPVLSGVRLWYVEKLGLDV